MEGKTNFFKVLETVWWPDLTDADPIFYAARVATTLIFVHTTSGTYVLVPTWCNMLSRTQFSSDVCRFATNWAVGGGRLSGYMIFRIGNLLGLGEGGAIQQLWLGFPTTMSKCSSTTHYFDIVHCTSDVDYPWHRPIAFLSVSGGEDFYRRPLRSQAAPILW